MHIAIRLRPPRPSTAEAADSPAIDLPERAWRIFDGVSARIEHADAKAAAILGACGVAAAAILGLFANRGNRDFPVVIAIVMSGVLVLAAAACSSAALWPRRMKKDSPENLLYFDHIVRGSHGSSITYGNDLRNLLRDSDALLAEISKQIWATSHVASKKYDWLDRGTVSLLAAFVALGISAIIFVIH